MKNLKIIASLKDGSSMPFEFKNGRELVMHFCGDDVRPPISHLVVVLQEDDGSKITITIPNEVTDSVSIHRSNAE